jgi:hypothetical protein
MNEDLRSVNISANWKKRRPNPEKHRINQRTV